MYVYSYISGLLFENRPESSSLRAVVMLAYSFSASALASAIAFSCAAGEQSS